MYPNVWWTKRINLPQFFHEHFNDFFFFSLVLFSFLAVNHNQYDQSSLLYKNEINETSLT